MLSCAEREAHIRRDVAPYRLQAKLQEQSRQATLEAKRERLGAIVEQQLKEARERMAARKR